MRFVVKGSSMTPTFKNGDELWASPLYYKLFKPKVNDIAIVKDPRDGRLLLKRIKEVKNNKYFIAGDNPKASTDSRQFGEVDKSAIIAKILFCYRKSPKNTL